MSDETLTDEAAARTLEVETVVQVRDATKREIDMRLVPWNVPISTLEGVEEFARGAFGDTDFSKVLLFPPEHEAKFGIGQMGQPVLTRQPSGRAIALDDREDGQYATFRVARTQAGDEQLALAMDGIVAGASIEFMELPGGTRLEKHNGRRKKVHVRADLRGASTTYRPAYGEQAAVLAVRSHQEKEDAPVAAEPVPAPEGQPTPPVIDLDGLADKIGNKVSEAITQTRSVDTTEAMEKLMERIEKAEENARASFDIPAKQPEGPPDDFGRGEWLNFVLRMMSGEHIPDQEVKARIAADLVTADNLGVVPDMFTGDVRETIETTRPFLESTRQLTIPRAGKQLNVPILATRPTVGVQSQEKDELVSTPTSITEGNFNPTSIGGYGDISLQLLKRSDPSYLELYLDLLAEAYGNMADDLAVDALLGEVAVNEGGALDPENLALGTAWANAVAISRRLSPDRIWLSSAAVAAFIDAKAADGSTPLYSTLQGNFTAAGGTGGTISGLRPVHVPALDDEAVDVIVGPSRGFGWAEDGTYTLQVDVPARAGRDVALIGMIWYAPLYPAAFTSFTLAGS